MQNRGMGFSGWFADNWFVLLQSAGIIASLVFTFHSLRSQTKASRVSNLLAITESHREFWSELLHRPELKRVLDEQAKASGGNYQGEEIFITFVIFHVNMWELEVIANVEFRINECIAKMADGEAVEGLRGLPPLATHLHVRTGLSVDRGQFGSAPLRKRTRPRPRRRAAEHQQRRDSGRKDVSTASARLRGATRGADVGGMNTAETASADACCVSKHPPMAKAILP